MKPYQPPPRFIKGPHPLEEDRAARDNWELAIAGDLTDKQDSLLDRLVEVPRGSNGTIYFESAGGSPYVGLGMATLIKLRGLKVTGVVLGECSSAALVPLAACNRRLVTPHSSLLFHPVHWQSEENVKLEEAAEWARHFKVLEEDLDRLLARLFDMPIEKLAEWTRPGRFVTGPEFVAAGLGELVNLFDGDLQTQLAARE